MIIYHRKFLQEFHEIHPTIKDGTHVSYILKNGGQIWMQISLKYFDFLTK